VDLRYWLDRAVGAIEEWAAEYGPFQRHPALVVPDQEFAAAFAALASRLHDNYPFFHPRYAGQMLKPPHPAAVAGYVAAMLINPNNHALDGGPATARMEKDVVADLAAMFGFGTHLGHLTSSGTIANLEALFVARQTHPDRGVAYSTEAHYTHARMCEVLRMPGYAVPADSCGRMDLSACEDLLRTGRVGTVVLTAGTTGLGAVDPVHEALALKERFGVRLHVDAAYGGFFTLLAGRGAQPADGIDPEPWRAIAGCDSVVIDPHKHGLQPYGCGCVLFADPAVGRFYAHDSPYTYFTSDELHLGEISLECSRAGAAAAALWVTLRVLPATRAGLGEVVAATRRAALAFAALVRKSPSLALYQQPELDIVSYFPRRGSLAEIDAASARALAEGMADPGDPVFLSTLRVTGDGFAARGHNVGGPAAEGPDARGHDFGGEGGARILRSVLMKPEQEWCAADLVARIERLAAPGDPA
jgi:glutamate/tyrosine decarboxylase-like PLP-dependent enzyme